MIQNTIIATINRYLKCDPERAQDLQSIDTKIISIVLKEFNTSTIFKIDSNFLHEVNDDEINPDVEIIVSLKILPDYFLDVDQSQFIKNGDLEIIGDSHVASIFHNVIKSIEIDWEDLLSKYIGDIAANQIGTAVDKSQEFIKRLGDNLRLDVRDYIQDELQIAATEVEVETFIKQVDETAAKLDQLEKRMDQLAEKK